MRTYLVKGKSPAIYNSEGTIGLKFREGTYLDVIGTVRLTPRNTAKW